MKRILFVLLFVLTVHNAKAEKYEWVFDASVIVVIEDATGAIPMANSEAGVSASNFMFDTEVIIIYEDTWNYMHIVFEFTSKEDESLKIVKAYNGKILFNHGPFKYILISGTKVENGTNHLFTVSFYEQGKGVLAEITKSGEMLQFYHLTNQN